MKSDLSESEQRYASYVVAVVIAMLIVAYQHLAPTTPPPLPIEHVTPLDDVGSMIVTNVNRALPILFINSVAAQWATTADNADDYLQRLSLMEGADIGFKVSNEANSFMHVEEGDGFLADDDDARRRFGFGWSRRLPPSLNVSRPFYYISHALKSNQSLSMFPGSSLFIVKEDEEEKESEVVLWLANRNTTTHCHIDLSYNFLSQLSGTKLVHLWKTMNDDLLFYPDLHVRKRKSQRRNVGSMPPPDFSVDLGAGETLWIPPFTPHHVTTTSETSVSVNVFTQSPFAEVFDRLFGLPLPFDADWSRSSLHFALRRYIHIVYTTAFDLVPKRRERAGDEGPALHVKRRAADAPPLLTDVVAKLRRRYAQLNYVKSKSDRRHDRDFCGQPDSKLLVVQNEQRMQRRAEAVAQLLHRLPRRDVKLYAFSSFVERCVSTFIGVDAQAIYDYLTLCL